MKIIHVVPRIITESSGPAYSVPRLCKALALAGAEVELHLVGDAPRDLDSRVDVHCYPQDGFLKPLCFSSAMKLGLIEAARRADIMHNHSLWLMPNIYPGGATRRSGSCKLVVSPRGTLSEWAMRQSRWKKKIVWALGQKKTCKRAVLFHATAPNEYSDIRRCGFKQPVAVIPNGVDIPEMQPMEVIPAKTLLFLSRIHPTKGVDSLLRVWAKLQHHHQDWHLKIAGPLVGEYPEKMKALAASMGLERVVFMGEVTGSEKSQLYFESDLFVLPTHSENFGLAVAESLAHGTPAIVSHGAPWEGLGPNNCGWWVEDDEKALESQLNQSMLLPRAALVEKGQNGRDWMQREFAWEYIGQQMLETYQWVKSGGVRPDVVAEH